MATEMEKALRLLEYLKKYTDKNNPTSMPLIDYYFKQMGYPDFFGTKNSKRRNKRELIKKLANLLNTDLDGNPLPKKNWVIVYDGYGEENEKNREFICNLYYNQPFRSWEVDNIIKSIEKNEDLDEDTKKELILKVKQQISNKNYFHKSQAIRRGMSPVDKKKFLIEEKQNKARRTALIKNQREYYNY